MSLYQVSSGDRILAADINQFYSILKGVAASGETATLIYNAAASLIFQPSSDPAAGTEAVQIKNNAGTVQSALSFDGRLYPADGLVGTPGIAYELDKDTGLYRIGANASALVAGGVEKLRYDATGISLDGGVSYLGGGLIDQVALSYWYWMPGMAIESTVTGTGALSTPTTVSYADLQTGVTSGSNSGLRKQMSVVFGTGVNGVAEVRFWKFLFATDKAASEAWRLFLTDEYVTGQPSLTAKHLGLRFDGTTVSFSTADGATEQTTNVSAFVAASTDYHGTVTFDGTTAKLYIDGTLQATHATNVPTSAAGVPPTFRAHITNSAGVAKDFYVGPQVVRGVA